MSKKIKQILLTAAMVIFILGVYLLVDFLAGGVLPGGFIFVG